MDEDQELNTDMYRDPDQMSRPVPLPRARSKPGSRTEFKPGLEPDSDPQKELSAEGDKLRGKQLFHKWRSLEKRPESDPGPGSRPKSKPWARPGLKDFRNIPSTEETQSEPVLLRKDDSMRRDIDFRGHPQTPEPGPGSKPVPPPKLPNSTSSSDLGLDSEPQSLRSDQGLGGCRPKLQKRPPFPSEKPHQQPHMTQTRLEPSWQTHLDNVFQSLERETVEFLRQQLQSFHQLLTSDKASPSTSQSASKEQDSELVLNLALNFLKRMDEKQLADILLTKSSGSVCQERLKSRLQQRFSQVFEGVAKAGSPAPLHQIYTDLYIIEGGASEVTQEHEVRHIESVSKKPAAPEKAITCEDIFKPINANRRGPFPVKQTAERPIRTVLTKGVAGVGKTVLTQKFSLDWAEGRGHQDVQLLLPFTFRELNVLKGRLFSLEGLIQHFFSQTKGLCSFEDLQLLFIFDGLDECRLPLDFSCTRVVTEPTESASVEELLVNLIRGSLLPSARLWITTRPAAANQIPAECVSMVTEVRGFTDPQKEQYFRKRFKDQHQATAIILHIKKSRTLYSMCYVPVFCWILSAVLQKILDQTEKAELPQTLTEMYIHFLVVQAKVKNIKYHEGTGADLPWTPENQKMVLSLGKLAFEQLQKGNLIFYKSDLSECGLDVAEIARYSGVFTEVFREEPGLYQDMVYCFIHLSVQEFLAALHVHQTFVSTGENLLVDGHVYGNSNLDSTEFYKSAVEICVHRPNGQLDLFLRFLLGLSLPTNQSLLRGLVLQTGSEKTNQETVQYVQRKVNEELSTDRVLNLFHCLNELQDSSLEQQMQNLLRSGVLDPSRLTPGQWAALVFLLLSSSRDLEMFDLRKFCPSENALMRLLPVLQASTKASLNGCHLTSTCCSGLGSILAGSSLRELDLSNNDLKDSGVEQLCEGLKSATCGLHTVRLSICNLTSQACSTLRVVLPVTNIKELDLSDNDLMDSGVERLCEGLKSPTCGLQTLRLTGCLLTNKGCFSLAAALKANPSHLQELDLSYNSFDPSESKMLTSLRDNPNHRLTTLKLDFCNKWLRSPGLAKYSCELSVDLNTANPELKVTDGLVMFTEARQDYPQHPLRFDWYPQVLCTVGPDEPGSKPSPCQSTCLSGRSYWEVEWSGGVAIAVTDSRIRRRGDHHSCIFGWNNHSWRLWCSEGRYAVCHDSKQQVLSVTPRGAKGRVGVFLDPGSGTLSFYEVHTDPSGRRDHWTHLHTFHGCLPQNPLPGIGFGLRSYQSTAFLCGVYEIVGQV